MFDDFSFKFVKPVFNLKHGIESLTVKLQFHEILDEGYFTQPVGFKQQCLTLQILKGCLIPVELAQKHLIFVVLLLKPCT